MIDLAFIKRRIDSVKVLRIEVILSNSESIAESLVMRDLTRSEKLDRLTDVGIVDKS